MEQFIRYLYEYRDGRPARNVGFVKVEKREDETTVHIHGKGLQLGNETELTLYLFYLEQDTPVGIPQGVITNINPAVNYRLIFRKEDTGNPEYYSRIQGILLESKKKRRFAAAWNDMPVNADGMRIWEEPHAASPTVTEAALEAVMADAQAPDTERRAAVEEAPVAMEVDPYLTPSKMQCRKIRRQDIALLPRCEWRLANNSFLLHGYYNYHHLLMIEDGEDLWLGVPGIYHKREAKAAEAFGFARFIDSTEEDFGLADDETESGEHFGYWCRKVRRMSSRPFP